MLDNILDYEKLVYAIIKKYINYCDFDDLYQVGMLGLIYALKNYKQEFNTKFSTYAYTYILGEVKKYLRENRNIKINKEILALSKVVNNAREKLCQKLNRYPTLNELSLFLEIPVTKIEEIVSSLEQILSLDYSLNDEGKELNLYDVYGEEEKKTSAEYLDLHNSLMSLTNSEKLLITSRFFDDLSQNETSKKLGISQVQVSRHETKILSKLKEKLTI